MGLYKAFSLFCQINELDTKQEKSWEFFRRDEMGLPWEEELGGECPACGKSTVKITRTGTASRSYCFYCGWKGSAGPGITLTPEQQRAEKQLREEKQARNSARALQIWDQCVPIGSNNTVATYFSARRLELPPDPEPVMRWHPRCPYGKGSYTEPCIVSLFRNATTDKPTAIHRTRIVSASAGKSERMAYGPIAGSAIKLWPLIGEELAVGEGIETVLAAVKLGIGSPPAWAATVAGNLSSLPVIGGVKRLTIISDNDPKKDPHHKTGQEHAQHLRRKWLDQCREVMAKMPKTEKDFNDVLIRRGRS